MPTGRTRHGAPSAPAIRGTAGCRGARPARPRWKLDELTGEGPIDPWLSCSPRASGWASHLDGMTGGSGCATGSRARSSCSTPTGVVRSSAESMVCRSRSTGCPTIASSPRTGRRSSPGPELEPYGARASRSTRSWSTDGSGVGRHAGFDAVGGTEAGHRALVMPDGTSREVADDVWFPNGMVILGDDTLVVAESHADRLTAWTITDEGELIDRRLWADLGADQRPTGSAATRTGRSGTRACPDSAASGWRKVARSSQSIEADRGCFACTLGGEDGRTLFIVANHYGADGASDGIILVDRVAVARRLTVTVRRVATADLARRPDEHGHADPVGLRRGEGWMRDDVRRALTIGPTASGLERTSTDGSGRPTREHRRARVTGLSSAPPATAAATEARRPARRSRPLPNRAASCPRRRRCSAR